MTYSTSHLFSLMYLDRSFELMIRKDNILTGEIIAQNIFRYFAQPINGQLETAQASATVLLDANDEIYACIHTRFTGAAVQVQPHTTNPLSGGNKITWFGVSKI